MGTREAPVSLIFSGGNNSVDEIVGSTERDGLVTHLVKEDLFVVSLHGLFLERFSPVQQAFLARDKFLKRPIGMEPVN